MKRMMYISLLMTIAVAAVSAQQWGPGPDSMHGAWSRHGRQPYSGPQSGYYREYPTTPYWEKAAVTGNLELIDGNIALRQDAVTYYITGLNRLVGFIDGLKEGAAVTLEGAARPLPGNGEHRVLLVSKLEINGKTYGNLSHRF
ncbi:MAG: hypothetical protein LBE17_04960 [Treponema sp.]|jgi:hypothetical protein|nr:hypothetical protein [Treponema sp.]